MDQFSLPVISSLYAGLLAIMLVSLALFVIAGRFKYKVGLGYGKNEDMVRRVRMHGNFVEYVPLLLIMMVIMEINSMHGWMLHTYGIGIILTRLSHAYGLYTSSKISLFRTIGMAGTFALLLIAAVACITRYIL